ncbi:MAG: LysR family transcriptional regulator, partial [Gammaproteobacteria bacterium]|nr:LysR family transcriptional regulator [Gammaproteobacteria bacterium]
AGATMDIQNVEFAQQLVIGCDQAFASQWLSPRLSQLRQLMPAITLRIVASDDYNESLGSEIQVAVMHGDGLWPGFQTLRLFEEEVFPVCSPGFDHDLAQQDWASWLLQAPLIDLADSHWNWMNWRMWFGGNNIDQPLANRNLQLNSYPLVIDAACAGHGVALGWRYLVDDLIADKKLVRPVEQSLKTDLGYYCIYRDNLENDTNVVRFSNWLRQQFGLPIET